MNKALKTAIRVEYTMLRAPLALLDERVVSRLDEHSRLRSTLTQGIGALDAAAARLLAEPSTPWAGGGTGSRSAASRPAGPEVLPAEEQEEVEELADELLEQQEEKTFVGELADEDLRRVQAELRAKHLVEEEHENR